MTMDPALDESMTRAEHIHSVMIPRLSVVNHGNAADDS
jgi:hypothetical protein